MARMCTKCGEKYSEQEIAELKSWGERMWFDPFICPDCYDSLRRNDLGDQAAELLDEKPAEQVG